MALLSYGSNGDAVKELQTNLNTVGGYNLDVDGGFGEKTKAAVVDYQKKNGLAVDGVVGDETNGSLAKAIAAKTAAAVSPTKATSPTKQSTSRKTSSQQTTVSKSVSTATPDLRYAEKAPDLTPYLDQWRQSAEEQAELQADYATEQGVKELQRVEEDAQKQFQTQRDQVDIDEAKALSNQALYSESRGDKGGIGAAQYASIQNTAAKNRLTVNQSQTKLATDTARQIADLRAQGEFQKADSLLEISQTYLTQLMQLQQWALSYNMSVDDFNNEVDRWKYNYEMQVAELTGTYRGEQTYAAKKAEEGKLADAGAALLDAGLMPSSAQLSAMGMTKSQAQSYINAVKAAMAGSSGSGSGSGSGGGGWGYDTHGYSTADIKALQRAAGIDVDGVWGPDTEQAYNDGWRKDGSNVNGKGQEKSTQLSRKPAGDKSNGVYLDVQRAIAQAGNGNRNAAYYVTAYNEAYKAAKSGKTAAAVSRLVQSHLNKGHLTETQADYIMAVMFSG